MSDGLHGFPSVSEWVFGGVRANRRLCVKSEGARLRVIGNRSQFDAPALRSGNARGDVNRFVQILGFNEIVTANLFLGFGEGSVGPQNLAVTHADGGGGGSRG